MTMTFDNSIVYEKMLTTAGGKAQREADLAAGISYALEAAEVMVEPGVKAELGSVSA